MEDTVNAGIANKWEFEQNYGKILAMIVVMAVREIEEQTGRQVLSLTIPKPANWENPDKHTTIIVRLGNRLGKRVYTYHGSKGNWFKNWFNPLGKPDDERRTP